MTDQNVDSMIVSSPSPIYLQRSGYDSRSKTLRISGSGPVPGPKFLEYRVRSLCVLRNINLQMLIICKRFKFSILRALKSGNIEKSPALSATFHSIHFRMLESEKNFSAARLKRWQLIRPVTYHTGNTVHIKKYLVLEGYRSATVAWYRVTSDWVSCPRWSRAKVIQRKSAINFYVQKAEFIREMIRNLKIPYSMCYEKICKTPVRRPKLWWASTVNKFRTNDFSSNFTVHDDKYVRNFTKTRLKQHRTNERQFILMNNGQSIKDSVLKKLQNNGRRNRGS
uniref:Uncharacterized protein n=1 Tax=Romanomermis culicivorax TaxID=13658 RepID=A0A915KCF6_ROMCU